MRLQWNKQQENYMFGSEKSNGSCRLPNKYWTYGPVIYLPEMRSRLVLYFPSWWCGCDLILVKREWRRVKFEKKNHHRCICGIVGGWIVAAASVTDFGCCATDLRRETPILCISLYLDGCVWVCSRLRMEIIAWKENSSMCLCGKHLRSEVNRGDVVE